MQHHNQLPPGYKSHLALLVDQWPFIQSLEREDMRIIPTYKREGDEAEPVGDTYHFDIQYLKSKAMEEMMKILPSPAIAADVLHVVRNGVEFSNIENYENHPAWTLAHGLFMKLAARQ